MTRFDAILIPLVDITSKDDTTLKTIVSSIAPDVASIGALGVSGALFFTEITQMEHDKGNVLTAHRVDGGYALTQRGGHNDDRIFIRVFLRGPQRFLIKRYIDVLADQKSIPLAFISREVVIAKCQIESVKMIAINERRETMVIHVIFRQLRSVEGFASFIGSAVAGTATYLMDKNRWFGVEDIYADDSSATGGGYIFPTSLTSTDIGG